MDNIIDINNSEVWNQHQAPSLLENNTLRREIGNRWLQQAEAEHASIASFARHTLQLMSLGAPSQLLIALFKH